MRTITQFFGPLAVGGLFPILLLGGCGAEAESARAGEATAGAATREGTTPGSTEIAQARELLAEVARTYRESPAVSDSLTVHIQDQLQVLKLRFAPGDERIEMAMPNAAAVKIEDTMYVTSTLMYDLYLEHPLENGMTQAIQEVLNWSPTYHFAMRETEDIDAYMSGFGLGIMRNPQLRGYESIFDDAGNKIHRLRMEAAEGIAYVHVDPQRSVITGMTMDLLPGPGQPAHAPRVEVRIEANPVLSDELEEPIVFDPGDRIAVQDRREMEPRPLRRGDRAPNFRLETVDGETVELRDLQGSVVVLDFWATWCVPCLIALPHFDRFAQWAADFEHPVMVYAVNTMERAATAEERLNLARNYWDEKDFTVPMLFDRKNIAVPRTGYNSLPLTLVIDPEGRISRVHDGFKRDLYQILKADTERALRQAAEAEESD